MRNFLSRIFRKPSPRRSKAAVEEVTLPPATGEGIAGIQYAPAQFLVGSGQSVGMQRGHNEDSLFSLSMTLAGEEALSAGVFIVADGMGGHQHGEVASDSAIRTMAKSLLEKVCLPMFDEEKEVSSQPIQEIMQDAVKEAQKMVSHSAPGGGTTLTAALVIGSTITIAHVGDSRAYLIDASGGVHIITRDHSFVMRLQELGQLTAEDAAIHPQRNVLYRAVGQADPFEADIVSVPFPRGASLLLCSDGLWGVIPETEIRQQVMSGVEPALACKKLVDAANAAGGPDNISVILVKNP